MQNSTQRKFFSRNRNIFATFARIGFAFGLASLSFVPSRVFASASAQTLVVAPAGQIRSVAEAVRRARPGDTVIVSEGTYYERNIRIEKPLALIGRGKAIVDAQGQGTHIIYVAAANVTIKGLTLRNVAVSYVSDNAAIKLENARYCVIENNTIEEGFFGVYLARSSDCRVAYNTLRASHRQESNSGNGVHCWKCEFMTIEGNAVRGHRDGVYLEFTRHGVITGNTSERNLRYGLHFMFSDSCSYERNVFSRNGAGVAVMYTKNVLMTRNRFENNWGPTAYGVLFKDITDSRMSDNVFYKNTTGLYAEGANRIIVEHNDFIENGWAVKIVSNSMDNVFKRNNFAGNTFDVATNSSHNFSVFESNYWSRYQGYDLNKDGVGDAPFRPVRLFSMLVAQQPPVLALLRSLFVDILDVAERVLPSVTPETLVDKRPQMKRIE